MKKFAFLVHLRSSYRQDLSAFAPPLGWIPDSVYRFALRNRPIAPFVWSEVTVTPNATEPEGYIIMLPYTGRQLLEQQRLMLPRINEALALAASKGAEIMGLGAFTSPITLGGQLVAENPHLTVTNGNAYTAVVTKQRISRLIQECPAARPTVALVGATGSVGTLVCKLLAKHQPDANYILIARNQHRLHSLAASMRASNDRVEPVVSRQLDALKSADVVVILTSAADSLLQANHLKTGAVVLDDTQPRNTKPALLKQRPDITLLDGGLVSVPHLRFIQRHIGLPAGISYACLAETMLLAQAHYPGNFSLGDPTVEQADYITNVAYRFSHLGFGIAPDHCFGRPVHNPAPIAREIQQAPQPRFVPLTAPSYGNLS
jgi:predicted amino acid dehydrogenase